MRVSYNGVEQGGGGGSVTAAAMEAALADPDDAGDFAATVDRRFVDPMAGTGWSSTTPAGGAAATWGAGKLTIVVPPSTAGGAAVERSSGVIPADAPEWDLLARLDVVAGDNSSATRIALSAGADNANCVLVQLWTNGTVELGKVVGGVYTGLGYGGASGLDSGVRTGGQLWMRLSRRLGGVFASWAPGSGGAVPNAWRTPQRNADDDAVRVAGGAYVRLSAATTNTSVTSGLTVDVLAIRARGSAPL